MVKKILLAFLVVLIVVQFIRPSKNLDDGSGDKDIGTVYQMPAEVHQIFQEKCYDCHSNNTVYPWYFNIQPVGWWMAGHVNEGKEELNFSAFRDYPEERAHHKLEEIMEVVTEGTMPLESYTWVHGEAKLSAENAAAITQWLTSLGIKPEAH